MNKLKSSSEQHEGMTTVTWSPLQRSGDGETDLTLIIDHYHFRVHKSILRLSMDYFRAMFSSGMCENDKETITLHMVSPKPFEIILEAIYTGSFNLNEDNIFQVIETAHVLHLCPSHFGKCKSYLNRLINDHYCFEVMHFCDSIHLVDVYSDARRYCLANFSRLQHTGSFLDLSPSQMFDYLCDNNVVIEKEIHILEAIAKWLKQNEEARRMISKEMLKELLERSVCIKDKDRDLDFLASTILDDTIDLKEKEITDLLGNREKQEDVFMFWALLSSTNADGLVDVVKLCQDTGQGTKYDSMTDIVERPGYDLGSAFCIQGHNVFLSGGGPHFGKMTWIRVLYKFDLTKSSSRWEKVGDLYETRRHHAMVAIGSKLYIFGGFGKFRSKNAKLDCFDLLSGTWETLPNMPTYEIKPVATTSQDCIIYIDRSYTVHCFDTKSSHWFSMASPVSHVPSESLSVPVSVFCSSEDPGLLTCVSNSEDTLIVKTLLLQNSDSNLECQLQTRSEIRKDGRYEGCVLTNKNLFIFLGASDVDDDVIDVPVIDHILRYSVKCESLLNVTKTNVRKALCMLPAPHLPLSFPVQSLKPSAWRDLP